MNSFCSFYAADLLHEYRSDERGNGSHNNVTVHIIPLLVANQTNLVRDCVHIQDAASLNNCSSWAAVTFETTLLVEVVL